jgi:hypothetical protein
MGKSNLHCFFHNPFFPYSVKKSLLLVDSWPAYSDMTVLELDKLPERSVEM